MTSRANPLNDQTIDLDHLPSLDRLRSLAMIMVIGVHAFGYAPQYNGLSYEITRFLINTVPVSVFFLVDGFLFSYKYEKREILNVSNYIKKSVYRLVIPWFLFSLFYVSIRYAFEVGNFFDTHFLYQKSGSEKLLVMYASAIAPQTYFLLSLFMIRITAPLTALLLRAERRWLIVLYSVYMIGFMQYFPLLKELMPIKIGQEPFIHAIWGYHFYLTGVILYRFRSHLTLSLLYFMLFLFPVVVVARYTYHTPLAIQILQYHYLLSLFMLFYHFANQFRVLDVFKGYTMGIYLLHIPVVMKCTAVFSNAISHSPTLSYFLIWSLSLLIAWGLTFILKQSRLGSFALGERSYRPRFSFKRANA